MGIEDAIERLRKLTDEALLVGLSGALRSNRGWTALVLAHLAEVEERRLHLLAACSSMFEYCTSRLGMSEDEACRRIDVARLARRYPALYARLASGLISLSVAALLKPHLTDANHAALIGAVSEKTVRQAREVLAAWFPQPDVPASIRKLPERRTLVSGSCTDEGVAVPVARTAVPTTSGLSARQSGQAISSERTASGESTAAATMVQPVLALAVVATLPSPTPSALPGAPPATSRRAPSIKPLSAKRYAITFTANAELKRKLELATDLLRHAVPSGDIATIVSRALDLLLEETVRRRSAKTTRPRAGAPASSPSAQVPAIESTTLEPSGAAVVSAANDAVPPEPPGESRHIPSAIRRAVLERDGLRCTWQGPDGVRCQSRAWLEHDHAHPRGQGGPHDTTNIRIYCRPHNQLSAEQTYGKAAIARCIACQRERRHGGARPFPSPASPEPVLPTAEPSTNALRIMSSSRAGATGAGARE
jgi:hypothetical protein